MQIQVIIIEIRMLVIRHEDIIITILQAHMSFNYKIVGDKKGEKSIYTHSCHFYKLDPFNQLGILIDNFSLLKWKIFARIWAGNLDERLVEVHGVVDVGFKTQETFEWGS
jgi:hypothetical protein